MSWKKARKKSEIIEFRESYMKDYVDIKDDRIQGLGFKLMKKKIFYEKYDVIK